MITTKHRNCLKRPTTVKIGLFLLQSSKELLAKGHSPRQVLQEGPRRVLYLTVSLKKQDATTHKEVKLLAYGRPQILIEDNNGTVWLMGEEFGSEMNATTSTGASLGDKSGYELTFAAMEKGFAKQYTGVIATDFAVTVGI